MIRRSIESDLPTPQHAVVTRPPPALQAMPWLLAAGASALFYLTRLDIHTFDALQSAYSARMAEGFGDCILHPRRLLYPHLLRLLILPGRGPDGLPDAFIAGQILGALSGGAAVGLLYWRIQATVREWRAALLGALFFAGSFGVWFGAAEATALAPALALSLAALALAWPSEAKASYARLGLAGAVNGAAALLDPGAIWCLIPLCAAAAASLPWRQAAWRALAIAGPGLAAPAVAYWIAWRHIHTLGGEELARQWLGLFWLEPPETGGALRIFLYFKTLKYALLYRSKWYVALPVVFGFIWLWQAWRQRPVPVAIFGLWALCGALRSLFINYADIQVWTICLPGVMGLLACSLDAGLSHKRIQRYHNLFVLAGSLAVLLFIGSNHNWVRNYERLGGYRETKSTCQRLADIADSDTAVILSAHPYFRLILNYFNGFPVSNLIDPESILGSSRASRRNPRQWTGQMVHNALEEGRAVYMDQEYLNLDSQLYQRYPEIRDLAALFGQMGLKLERLEGFQAPFIFVRLSLADTENGGDAPLEAP